MVLVDDRIDAAIATVIRCDRHASAAAREAANGPPVIVRLVSSRSAALKGTRLRRIGVKVAATRCPFSVTANASGRVSRERSTANTRIGNGALACMVSGTRVAAEACEADRPSTTTVRHAAARAIERSRWRDG